MFVEINILLKSMVRLFIFHFAYQVYKRNNKLKDKLKVDYSNSNSGLKCNISEFCSNSKKS